MDIREMLALISDPLDKWRQLNSSADIHTLCVEENGQHAGVDIFVGYSVPRNPNSWGYFETKIQVPRTGEVTVGKPKRV